MDYTRQLPIVVLCNTFPFPSIDYTRRLPTEVLCNIFRSVRLARGVPTAVDIARAESETASTCINGQAVFRLAWISLSHVCSRWRTVAVNERSLWTDIPITLGTQWLHKFFWRSSPRAISVDWKSAHEATYKPVLDVLNATFVPLHHRRLRNFQAYIKEGNPLFAVLLCPWLELVEAEVVLAGEFPTDALLANHAPRLATLTFQMQSTFRGCSTSSLQAPYIKTPVTLDVTFEEGVHGELMGNSLNVFGDMHHLRHLRLGDACVYGRDHDLKVACCTLPERIQPVALQTLAVAGDWFTIKHIIKHLLPSPTVRVSLSLRVRPIHVRKSLSKENLPKFDEGGTHEFEISVPNPCGKIAPFVTRMMRAVLQKKKRRVGLAVFPSSAMEHFCSIFGCL